VGHLLPRSGPWLNRNASEGVPKFIRQTKTIDTPRRPIGIWLDDALGDKLIGIAIVDHLVSE